jgi:hypothetical protein
MSMFTPEDYALAARAAGLDIWTGGNHFEELGGYPVGLDSNGGYEFIWNPPDNAGDALRLACDLGLSIFTVARTSSGQACVAVADCNSVRLSEVTHVTDVRAATRYAIFLAAIAIATGKTL